MNKYLRLLIAVAICESAGLIGSFFTFNSLNTWYISLSKPFFNPPSWIFAPVWLILYLLMGISLYLVWGIKKVDLKWFWAQLVLNILWSVIFFGLKNPALSFVEIIFLWISIFLTIRGFVKFNKNAAYLFLPYLTWVTFAGMLNLFIVLLNS